MCCTFKTCKNCCKHKYVQSISQFWAVSCHFEPLCAAEASDKVMVLLFVVSAVTGDAILRSQIIAGKSTRQDTMLIVIRFITNLKNKKTKHSNIGSR